MKKVFFKCSLTALGFLVLNNHVYADNSTDQWLFTLRNAYINRDFENDALQDQGSWSQAVSLFYKSNMLDTPLNIVNKPIQVGVDASVQYAVRLSSDRHVSDAVIPFDKDKQSQAPDYFKHGATLKVGYGKSLLRVGELWLDVPLTSVDKSRQLLTSYWGTNFKSQITDHFNVEFGRVEKVSPRNEEDFRKFSMTINGVKHISDGLDYIDLRYQFLPNLKGEYYFGHLEDLYNMHYVSLEHHWKQKNFNLNSKLKYFNTKENANDLNIDAQNLGILETVKVSNHSFGLGYQQITGDSAFPLPDGFLPELYFINWNTIGFFKKDERSYHFIYGYDFKNYVPGLNAAVKYVYGDNFKTVDGKANQETETDLMINYEFQQPYLKGLGMHYGRYDYRPKYGNDFVEHRIFLNYRKSF